MSKSSAPSRPDRGNDSASPVVAERSVGNDQTHIRSKGISRSHGLFSAARGAFARLQGQRPRGTAAERTTVSQPVNPNSAQVNNEIFKPLAENRKEIRLVVLLPSDVPEASIQCELKTVSLLSNPTYEALSWAWGNPSETEVILLNGHQWWAPVNLVAGLKNLRYSDRTRLLWVDALCINQSSQEEALRERGQQVKLMKFIYSFTSHVIVWMGPISKHLERFLIECFLGDDSLRDRHIRDRANVELLVQEWLNLAWWRRLWVIQEVSLSRMASICLGKENIPFRHAMRELSSFILERSKRSGHVVPSQLPGASLQALGDEDPLNINYVFSFPGMFEDQAALYRQELGSVSDSLDEGQAGTMGPKIKADWFSFMEMVIACRFQLTTDPRDKLFGLLGLSNRTVQLGLDVNYNCRVEDVYISTTRLFIQKTGSLYILSQAKGCQKSSLELPSWVPDWTVPEPDQVSQLRSRYNKDDRQYIFDASMGTVAVIWNHPPERPTHCDVSSNIPAQQRGNHFAALELSGLVIDVISKASPADDPARLKTLKEFSKHFRDFRHCEEMRTFWRTAFQGAMSMDSFLDDENQIAFQLPPKRYNLQMREIAPLHSKYLGFSSVLCPNELLDLPESLLQNESFDVTIKELSIKLSKPGVMRHLKRSVANNKFFQTFYGFFGLGAADLRPGDEIWILAGGATPFVLRPVRADKQRLQEGLLAFPGPSMEDCYYRLVGEAYIDSLMNGSINLKDFPAVAMAGRAAEQVLPPGQEPVRSLGAEQGAKQPNADCWRHITLI